MSQGRSYVAVLCSNKIYFRKATIWYTYLMSESIPTPENNAEQFPSMDKVIEGFDRFLEGAGITKILNQVEDEDGLFVFDVEAKLANGETVEYCYKRARTTEIGNIEIPSRIHTVRYDADGMPCGTGPQYDLVNGDWIECS